MSSWWDQLYKLSSTRAETGRWQWGRHQCRRWSQQPQAATHGGLSRFYDLIWRRILLTFFSAAAPQPRPPSPRTSPTSTARWSTTWASWRGRTLSRVTSQRRDTGQPNVSSFERPRPSPSFPWASQHAWVADMILMAALADRYLQTNIIRKCCCSCGQVVCMQASE